MILEIDMGNTRIKWRLRTDSGSLARGVAEDYDGIIKALPNGLPDRVRVASVRGDEQDEAFSHWCRKALQVEAEFAYSEHHRAGVTNSYAEPALMGVDRWLGMLATFNQWGGPSLVVQAGTALTVDLLDATGQHLGGYIAPGRRILHRGLADNTSRVHLIEEDLSRLCLTPGADTISAVRGGSDAMMVGLVERGRLELAKGDDTLPTVVLAGGDSKPLAESLPGARLAPELVLDGLRWAQF